MLKILERIFTVARDPFDQAPFLFPWYVSRDRPRLIYKGKRLTWGRVENIGEEFVGLTTLVFEDQILAAFRIYNYLLPLVGGEFFCVWQQSRFDGKPSEKIAISLFTTSSLTPIKSANKKLLSLHECEDRQFLIESRPIAEVEVPLTGRGSFHVQFPAEFRSFGNFIAVVGINNLYDEPSPGDTALAEIFPQENKVSIYPQDWFNKDDRIDFGYQWITRAVRPRPTGRILGQGIRINDFELDESNCQILNG